MLTKDDLLQIRSAVRDEIQQVVTPLKSDLAELRAQQNRIVTEQVTLGKRLESLEKGQASLQKGQEALQRRLEALEKGQVSLQKGQEALEKGQVSLQKGQEALQQHLDRVEAKLSREVQDMAAIVNEILSKMADLERQAEIEKRVERIERHLSLPPLTS